MFRFIFFILFGLIVANSVVEYGEFDMKMTSYDTCKAPRKKFCADVRASVHDDVWLKFDVMVKENMTIIRTVYVGMLNNKEVVRIRIKNLCEHVFFKPLLQATYNVTSGCGLFKGHHSFSVDIQSVSRTIYGGKFMYGNWTFRSLYFNDDCNLHCGVMKMIVSPRKRSEMHI